MHLDEQDPDKLVEQMAIPDEEIKERMEAESPDGRPANRPWGRHQLIAYVLGIVAFVAGASILMEMILGWPAGLMVLAVLVIFLFLNPPLWAAVGRVRDRDRIVREIADETAGQWRSPRPRS